MQNMELLVNQAREHKRRVFCATATIRRGRGVCYDSTYGTATDADGTRDGRVVAPSTSNNNSFAGVCFEDKTPKDSNGDYTDILEPGSVCQIATLIATTVGVTRLTALASSAEEIAGCFAAFGLAGRGSALALQTLAAVTGPTDYSIAPISSSLDGSATFTASSTQSTITKAGAFTNVPATPSLQGNEYIYVVAGTLTNGMTTPVTPGRYKIVSKTSDNVVVVDGVIGTTASSIAFYCVRGLPVVMARLDDGQQSGLTEWLTPDSANTDSPMVGGYTFVFGGATLTTSDTGSLSAGLFVGQFKVVKCMGTIGTGDYILDGTAGATIDGFNPAGADTNAAWTDISSVSFDAANERALFQYNGAEWVLLHKVGATVA